MVSRSLQGIRLFGVLAGLAMLCAACGQGFAAPAAVVDGRPITQQALAGELDQLLADPRFAQAATGSAGAALKLDYTRRLLALLIRRRVIEDYAAQKDITVTSHEVHDELVQVVNQVGGGPKFDALLRQRHLTLADVRENIRTNLLNGKVEAAVVGSPPAGASPGQSQPGANQAKFDAWVQARLAAAGVEVNPRFGSFDPKLVVRPIDSTELLSG